MLSIQDVLDYCDLDRGEIEAIAEHEHIPITLAAEMSCQSARNFDHLSALNFDQVSGGYCGA